MKNLNSVEEQRAQQVMDKIIKGSSLLLHDVFFNAFEGDSERLLLGLLLRDLCIGLGLPSLAVRLLSPFMIHSNPGSPSATYFTTGFMKPESIATP